MNFHDALALVKSEIKAGFILDFYTTPSSIIAITDQGEFIFWTEESDLFFWKEQS